MKERPILFSGPMVRAILDGRKTQTRRIVKAKHLPFMENLLGGFLDGKWNQRPLPYGQPGDRLWVREAWANTRGDDSLPTYYRSDERIEDLQRTWKPSIHMPRWASRITLEITGVRVERLQDISDLEARQEGLQPDFYGSVMGCKRKFIDLWESINGPGSWAANPRVWVIEFRRIKDGLGCGCV